MMRNQFGSAYKDITCRFSFTFEAFG